MTKIRNFFLAILLMLAPLGAMAQSGGQCSFTEEVLAFHYDNLGQIETISMGLDGTDLLLTLLVNFETETWAMITTDETGWSCFQMSGQGFVPLSMSLTGDPA
jgi:hypothetical protein